MNTNTVSNREFAATVLEAAASNFFLLKEVRSLPRGTARQREEHRLCHNQESNDAYGQALREFQIAKIDARAAQISAFNIQKIINNVRYI